MILQRSRILLPVERQHKILEILKKKDLSKLDEIHKSMPNVSISTLRRDIKTLENEDKVEYLFGGAVRLKTNNNEVAFAKKALTNKKAKELISDLALKQVNDNDTIYIDSGSTCTLLLEKIINKKITVYTTNTQVCNITGDFNANIILIGGDYNGVTLSLTGSLTDSILSNLHFNKAFFGINGIAISGGFTTPHMEEAIKKQIVAKRSMNSYVLGDSSKYGTISSVKALSLKDATIISDSYNADIGQYTKIICS